MRNTFGIISVVLVLCVVAGVFVGCDCDDSPEMVANRFHRVGYDEDGRELPDAKEVPWKNDGESWWGREGMKMPDSSDEEKLFPWQKRW